MGKIHFNRQKVKETIATLEEEEDQSEAESNQSAEDLKKRVAEIVRNNNATETSIEKVNSFLALNKLHKRDKESELGRLNNKKPSVYKQSRSSNSLVNG